MIYGDLLDSMVSSYRSSYSRKPYSRSTYARKSSMGRRFSAKTTRQGRDTVSQTCKTSTEITLLPDHPLVGLGKANEVIFTLNMWTLLAGSQYGQIIPKMYDEVRLDGVTLDFVFKNADGVLSTTPAFIASFAWDRNGISTTEMKPNGDYLIPKIKPNGLSSLEQKNGNYFQAFKYRSSIYASSIAEKGQFVPASALADTVGGVPGDMLKYLGLANGGYINGGSYCFRPTMLISVKSPIENLTSASFSVTASFRLTCRGVRMLLQGPLSFSPTLLAESSDVRLGKMFYNSSNIPETGSLVTLSPQEILVGQLGGDIQIGTPGVFYDGSTVVKFQDTPADPLTYNLSYFKVNNDRYPIGSFSSSVCYYEFSAGEYVPTFRAAGNYLFFVEYSYIGEKLYALWFFHVTTNTYGVSESDLALTYRGIRLTPKYYGYRDSLYGVQITTAEISGGYTAIVPYLEGGIELPYTTLPTMNGSNVVGYYGDNVDVPPPIPNEV